MNQEEVNEVVDNGHMIFCFDMDGTITELDCPSEIIDIKPKMDVINRIKYLYENGNIIIIYTGRPESKREVTAEWLHKYGVPWHEIHFDKPKAHIYIDDSTIDIDDYMISPDFYDRKFLEIGNNINKQWRDKK